MTSGYGLFMLGLVGLDVVLDPRGRKWVVPLLIPAALYGAWYLTLGRGGIATYGKPLYPQTSWRSPGSSSMGWRRRSVPRSAAGRRWAGSCRRIRRVDRLPGRCAGARSRDAPIACLLAIAAEYTIVGIVRAQLEVDASLYTRYAYLSGILALVAAASSSGADHPRRTTAAGGRRRGGDRGLLAGLERRALVGGRAAIRRASV